MNRSKSVTSMASTAGAEVMQPVIHTSRTMAANIEQQNAALKVAFDLALAEVDSFVDHLDELVVAKVVNLKGYSFSVTREGLSLYEEIVRWEECSYYEHLFGDNDTVGWFRLLVLRWREEIATLLITQRSDPAEYCVGIAGPFIEELREPAVEIRMPLETASLDREISWTDFKVETNIGAMENYHDDLLLVFTLNGVSIEPRRELRPGEVAIRLPYGCTPGTAVSALEFYGQSSTKAIVAWLQAPSFEGIPQASAFEIFELLAEMRNHVYRKPYTPVFSRHLDEDVPF